MSRGKIFLILSLSAVIWAGIAAYGYYTIQQTKNDYKKTAKKLEKLIVHLDRKVDKGAQKSDQPRREYKFAAELIVKQESEWKKNIESFEKILHKYPDHKYAGDVAFCLALEYTVLSETLDQAKLENPYRQKAKDTIIQLPTTYKKLKIHPWTRTRFKTVFWDTFENENGSLFSIRTQETKRIYGYFLMQQAEADRASNHYQEARELYELIGKEYSKDPISQWAQTQMTNLPS